MSSIDEFLDGIDYLPPVPRNLAVLTELLSQNEVEVAQVVEIIQYDPALTAEVLRLCNSAYFGSTHPASDLQEAIVRLGFSEIFQLVAILSVATIMSGEHNSGGLTFQDLWRHSVTTALAGREIAIDRQENASLVFTACILHDLGKVLFARELGNEYEAVLALCQRNQIPLLIAERTVLGFDHAELGGRLLEYWKFPPELVNAARFHHDPAAAPSEHTKLAAYAHIADMLACFMGHGCGQAVLALSARDAAMDAIGISSEALARYLKQTWSSLGDSKTLIGFSGQGCKV